MFRHFLVAIVLSVVKCGMVGDSAWIEIQKRDSRIEKRGEKRARPFFSAEKRVVSAVATADYRTGKPDKPCFQ